MNLSVEAGNLSEGALNLSDYGIWSAIIQIAFLCVILLVSNVIRRKIPLLRKTLLPTAVIAGFLVLGFKYLLKLIGLDFITEEFMTAISYHTLGIGFIALTLKAAEKRPANDQRARTFKSGVFIVVSYIMQCLLGVALTMFLSATFFPDLFDGAGVLLMLGYGQGPGQAGNFGNIFEQAGHFGMQSFGFAVASIGFLWACIGGVIYMNIMAKKKKLVKADMLDQDEKPKLEQFMDENEVPHSEAIDKLTIQIALCFLIYGASYLFMYGVDWLAGKYMGAFGKETVQPLVWGFNYIWAVLIAFVVKFIIRGLQKTKIMHRQYTNNYLLNRIGGIVFDFMIVASIAAIDMKDLMEPSLWIPLLVLTTVGGVATLFFVIFLAKRVYKGYWLEGMLSMYGILTGTVSTGMILLREIDPEFKTPAANNLIFGSTAAIALGAPLILLLDMVTKNIWLFMGIAVVLFAIMMFLILFEPKRKRVN